ncbi:hypothetical protein EV645_2316 [Kribbella rubisoli]|jgi:hypothetical protein|uniref:Bulb-type lectin domain-containing protein n=1 Tax=Kribbella rubisoli TaxID=3075929 RepID=A0A4Q7XBU2_9ACTN|nr:hypothetical protein [Kribbella rubisoli]RZU20089.1 hypothetical protein EV645_2316 [Kribbella rubisoli]
MVRRLLAGLLAVGAMLGGAVVAAPAEAAVKDTLLPGQKLLALQSIKSASGVYTLTMQRNGNVTLLQRGAVQPLWMSNTYRPGAVLVMGTDGVMRVIYGRTAIWAMGAASPQAKLVLPNTGLLGIYNTRNKAVWNRHMVIGTLMPNALLRSPDSLGRDVTMYSTNHVYTLQLLANGNLVFLKNGKTVLWSTGKTGWPESRAYIDSSGRFGTLNRDGDETWGWDSRRAGTVVQIRNDGHFLLIHGRTIVKTFV